MVNSEFITLNERSQTQKSTCFMIPLMTFWKSENKKNGERSVVARGWARWEVMVTARDVREFGEVMRLLCIFSGQLPDCVHVPKFVDLPTKKDDFYCI